MKNEIAKGLLNSYSYTEYRKKVTELLLKGQSTGNQQTEDLLHYSTLNETRMNRLDKTLSVPENVANELKNLKKEYTWLVLTEGWCGDAAQINPILFKMASVTDRITLRFVLRDENEGLMGCFLTNGSRSIPKVIILENVHNDLKSSWDQDLKEQLTSLKVIRNNMVWLTRPQKPNCNFGIYMIKV